MGYLPRLEPEFYRGNAVVHWVLPVARREIGWLNQAFHGRFREMMLHVCVRESLMSPVYCLMPDHIHLIWMGLHPDSDQTNGIAFLRTYLEPSLAPAKSQHQAWDHVLDSSERRRGAFAATCEYILENPVRAGLARAREDWEFNGAAIPGFADFNPTSEGFWSKFWKIYVAKLAPSARQRALPPRRGGI